MVREGKELFAVAMSVRRTEPKRASIVLSYTYSTIFEDFDSEENSVSEVSESFDKGFQNTLLLLTILRSFVEVDC